MKLLNKKILLVLMAALLVVAMSASIAMADPVGTQPQQPTNPDSTQQLTQPQAPNAPGNYPYPGYCPWYGTVNPDFQPNYNWYNNNSNYGQWNMWGRGMGWGCW